MSSCKKRTVSVFHGFAHLSPCLGELGAPQGPVGKGGTTADSLIRQRAGPETRMGAALAPLLTSPVRPDWEGGMFSAFLQPAAASSGTGGHLSWQRLNSCKPTRPTSGSGHSMVNSVSVSLTAAVPGASDRLPAEALTQPPGCGLLPFSLLGQSPLRSPEPFPRYCTGDLKRGGLFLGPRALSVDNLDLPSRIIGLPLFPS